MVRSAQRVLVRHDFSRDLADLLLDDLRQSLPQLSNTSQPRRCQNKPLSEQEAGGFRH